jgi:hypothetical protein
MTRGTLWIPSTAGEEFFQELYEVLGKPITVGHPAQTDLEYLVRPTAFAEAVRLTATVDVAMRSIRAGKEMLNGSKVNWKTMGKALRTEVGIPLILSDNARFCQLAIQTAEIAKEKPRSKDNEAKIRVRGKERCYLCDSVLKTHGNDGKPFSVEHVWPQSMGGDSRPDNLLPACAECNSNRQHQVSWATGPVFSTWLQSPVPGDKGAHAITTDPNAQKRKPKNETPSNHLSTSLALARLAAVASGESWSGDRKGQRMTLKAAALAMGSVRKEVKFPPDTAGKRFTFFELMDYRENLA